MTSTANPQLNDLTAVDGEDRFARFVAISVGFHVLLFIAFAVRAFFAPSDAIPMDRAIRVDIVALPDKPAVKISPRVEEAPPPSEAAKPEPAKPEVKTPPKVELPKQAEPDKINLNKTKQDQAAALKRLSAIEKLQKASAKAKTQNETAPAPAQVMKGNEVSAGNSLSGLTKLEHENYTESVYEQVKRRWNLPQWMASASLKATVRIFVDSRGVLIKKEMIRSSQNPVFDQSVMTAIDAASPLPRPPNNLVNLISVRGIDIEFIPSEN